MPENSKIPTLAPEDFYLDQHGLMVFTREHHLKRGTCCENGCRHCPWGFSKRREKVDEKPTGKLH